MRRLAKALVHETWGDPVLIGLIVILIPVWGPFYLLGKLVQWLARD